MDQYMNFVPISNRFQSNNSLDLNPWIVQVRGCLELRLNGSNFMYTDENGTESKEPTIIYADGTDVVPSDRPHLIFIRSKCFEVCILPISYMHIAFSCSLQGN